MISGLDTVSFRRQTGRTPKIDKTVASSQVAFSGKNQQKDEFILVTGGAGYIGSHFVDEYLKQKPGRQKVVIVDDLSEGHSGAIRSLKELHPGRVRFIKAKIGDRQIKTLLGKFKVKAIVHFAASASVAESQRDPMKYLDNNVCQTIQLLKSAQAKDVQRFVFSSTAAVYGNPARTPIAEDSETRPINNYGHSKLFIEKSLAQLKHAGKLSYIALRYFNAAGANESGKLGEAHRDETHLIPLVLKAAKGERQAVKQFGNDYDTPDGTCNRDYIHVQDLADAHIKALDYLEKHPETGLALNLGTGAGNSVREVIETCRSITGKPIAVELAPRRPGDPARLVASYERVRETLGWQPRRNLEEIVKTAWQWEQSPRFAEKAGLLERFKSFFLQN